MNPLPLFVFGTLRRGKCNHHYLAGHYEQMQSARLPGFARLAPLMIDRAPDGIVEGELYFLRAAEYERTLRDCDALEGIPPGETSGTHYQRLQVRVETAEGEFSAWAYVRAY